MSGEQFLGIIGLIAIVGFVAFAFRHGLTVKPREGASFDPTDLPSP